MKHPSNCVRTADTFINNDYAQQSGIHRFAKERAIVAVNFTRPIQLGTHCVPNWIGHNTGRSTNN